MSALRNVPAVMRVHYAGHALAAGIRSYFDPGYCIDAPGLIPQGSHKSFAGMVDTHGVTLGVRS